ncbi:hypothetical protein G6F40_016790 [Rhizopus arrhizus]|nr:hypothetical protein G6F40_016790 [Rhizopus arrhizus]
MVARSGTLSIFLTPEGMDASLPSTCSWRACCSVLATRGTPISGRSACSWPCASAANSSLPRIRRHGPDGLPPMVRPSSRCCQSCCDTHSHGVAQPSACAASVFGPQARPSTL